MNSMIASTSADSNLHNFGISSCRKVSALTKMLLAGDMLQDVLLRDDPREHATMRNQYVTKTQLLKHIENEVERCCGSNLQRRLVHII